ncbi:MAG: site-specific DNA-methyltransferase [Oceanisphaera sp.]|uniref:site-specific DNA-methyltransferase n=1 Tax=Oceanisphaera sp. TaxID=1929979 RepID=UPI003F9A0BAC
MDKLKMHSKDVSQDNLAKIQMAFPNCVTERQNAQGQLELAVDFDLLRQELSANIVEGPQERYRLDWPGKRKAMLTANAPIAKTLRPARDESVNFDDTENLFIEGDNLDALKLLQETYLGKVKMIYIDPPYNTGKDFVYEDDFAESTEKFLQRSNQKDEQGNHLVSNPESRGRFHSDWLSMMLPRLKLARNLLQDDGVIAISIDDGEVHGLKKICDELLGEKNFIAECTIVSNPRGRQSDTYIANVHDKLLVWAKDINTATVFGMPLTDKQKEEFNFTDENGEPYRLLGLRQRGAASYREDRPDMFFPIYVCPETKKISFTPCSGWEAVYPRKSDRRDGRWMWGKDRCVKDLDKLVARLIERRMEHDIFVKDYLNKNYEERTRKFKSLWDLKGYNNQNGTQEVKRLFGVDVMSFPKPRPLLEDICRLGIDKNDTVLDFFAGSATTAHAVMQLNAEDGGNRKFIMVQLPEAVDEKHEAYKAGYKTIAEISKERIRRAGKQILEGECHEDWNQDIGFRVLKVDTSNMQDVYYQPQQLSQDDLFSSVDNIKPDRSSEDLLFQVLLDWGVDLTLPIRRETMQGKEVFIVDDNALAACFEQDISEALINDLAELNPLRVVFRDTGFATDAVKVNATQIFKQRSPITEVKSI